MKHKKTGIENFPKMKRKEKVRPFKIESIYKSILKDEIQLFKLKNLFPLDKVVCYVWYSFILFFLSFSSYNSQAQVIPPSPGSSTLIRNITNPVNYATGVVGIQIPLHTFTCGDIHIPIALSYQAFGIKVRDAAAWTGLGWNLSTGGKITRMVRKRPDENGYNRELAQSEKDGVKAASLQNWYNNFLDWHDGDFDGEPDVYYYELPDRSGMFVRDVAGKAWTIPYQPLDIRRVNNEYFIISDERGNTYTFGVEGMETSEVTTYTNKDATKKTFSYTSTWNLTAISDACNNQVRFNYISGKQMTLQDRDTRANILIKNDNGIYVVKKRDSTIQYSTTVIQPKYLRYMVGDSGDCIFFESEEELENEINTRRLSEIKIYNTMGDYLKSIRFGYSYFGTTSKRLKLDKVYEYANAKTLLLGCFEYAPWYIPNRETRDFDHWGYYNKANNKSDLVKEVFLGIRLPGASREANLTYARSGVLTRIYTATGGYIDYEYELNQGIYKEKDLEKAIEGGGLRIKAIRQYTNDNSAPIETTFSYTLPGKEKTSGTVNSRFLYYYGKGWTYQPTGGGFMASSELVLPVIGASRSLGDIFDYDGASIHYNVVTVHHPDGSRQEYYYTGNEKKDEPSLVYEMPALHLPPIPNTFDGMPNSSRFWRRGLLWQEIIYDSNNDTLRYTYNHYDFKPKEGSCVAGYVPGLMIGYDDLIGFLWKYEWISEAVLLKSTRSWGQNQPEQEVTYIYSEDDLLPLEIKTKNKISGEETRVVYHYPKDYLEEVKLASSDYPVAYALCRMLLKQIRNLPVEVISLKDNKVVGGQIYEYKVIDQPDGKYSIWLAEKKNLLLNIPRANYVAYHFSEGLPVCDSNYETERIYDQYNKYGKLVTSHVKEGNYHTIIYGYNETLPVAVVENAHFNQVYYSNFAEDPQAVEIEGINGKEKVVEGSVRISMKNFLPGTYQINSWISTDNGQSWSWRSQLVFLSASGDIMYQADSLEGVAFISDDNSAEESVSGESSSSQTEFEGSSCITVGLVGNLIKEVQIIPQYSFITTADYIPGIGKTSESDQNGKTSYYQYDELGRLIRLLDDEGNVLNEYDYYIAP